MKNVPLNKLREVETILEGTLVLLKQTGAERDRLRAENDELRQEIADRADSEKRTTEMLVEVLRDLERARARITGLERELYAC